MYFTEGRLHTYEHMMQEKPKHNSESAKTVQDRDCKHCLHFDEHHHKCSKKKCVIFNE